MSVFSRLRQLFHRSSRRVSQRSARQSSLSQRHQRRSVLRAELLEERKLMASDLHYFVTTEHTDLASAYSGGWSLGVSEDIQGDLPLDETLVYVGTNAQLNRPTDPQWNFTGVPANALFYVGSQTQEDGFLYFGADASGVAPSLLNTTNVATESKNRITGNNKWVKYSLLDVDHFNPDGTPGTGNFSMWSSGSFGTPLVLMSSYNDGTANPNGNGLDVTDGISSDDALWLPAGGHVHYNFGFTQAGRYEVHLQTSANFVSGGVIASDPMDPFILYFSVGSVGQLEFDNASYSVDESAGSATIRVERVGGSDGEITVDYAMAGVSATAGSDFTSSSGTLTFADKETEKLITIPIINDTDSESDETISLSLSLPGPEIIEAHYDAFESRSLLGAQSTAVLTILANDTTSNTPPSISDIGDQATQEDTATNSIAFTVNDAQTAAAALIVTATSSNPTLVPNGNIVLGGSGANRTVTITPAPNQFGNTTITLTVTDEGGLTATDTFLLTVNSVNDAPTISDIGDQSTDEDTPTGNIPFTIGDVETAAGALEVTFTSSNTTLVPIGNIVLGGSGANRNVVVTPQAHQAGTALITARVTDAGGLTTSDTFTLTVGAINDAPTISDVGNQSTDEDTSTGEIAFTVDDFETATGSLVVTATSSNATLVPNANIVLGGSGANRTVTITPAANLSGSTTITLTVTDAGGLTATDSFLLTVNPVNDLPTISDISDRFVLEGSSTGPIPFSVGDLETPAADLVVTATSSNQAIIPNGNIVFGGSGSNRTISLTSIDNQAGTSIITVTVTDASGGQASDTFVLTAGDLVRATFDRSALIVNATNPTDVRLADMDNDGDLDVLFASYITSISFLPSNGDGTFGTEVTLPALTVSDIHVADVDGDSLLDIVSSVYVDSTYAETAISVWRNLGGGSFSGRAIVESTRTTAFVGLVGVGDVDGDGLNDLVLSNNGLSWSRNQVGGTFGAVSTISTGGINYSSVLEDIDQDGDLDIVEAALVSDNFRLQVYRNSGTSNPSFTAEQIASFGSNAIRNIAIGDTNQDGFDDIHLLRGGSNRDIVALHGTSSGTFQAPVVLGSGSNLTDLEIGEIDGDGRPDLALTAQEQNQVLFAQNLGGGVFTELQEFSHDGSSLNPYPEAVAIGDLDLDGRNDLVFSERFGNGIAWSRNRSEENITELVPPASRTYLNGYDLTFEVFLGFNVNINTSAGSPTLQMIMGPPATSVQNPFRVQANANVIKFQYQVQSTDLDLDGIQVATSIDLNGAVITDAHGRPIDPSFFQFPAIDTSGILVNGGAPSVTGITRLDANPATSSSVRFEVTFSEAVSGVTIDDFALDANGPIGAAITSVTGSGSSYVVTASTGAGDGTLRLRVLDNDSIVDSSSYQLGGAGVGNGQFAYGQGYTLRSSTATPVFNNVVTDGHLDLALQVLPGDWYGFWYGAGWWETEDTVISAGPDASSPRPADATWDFLGVPAGEPVWVFPETFSATTPWPGVGAYFNNAGDFASYFEADSRVNGTAPWIKLQLLDVRGPEGGEFSLYQSGITAPTVFMSSHNGIDSADAAWIPNLDHVHYNWAFSKPGLYQVDISASGYIDANGSGVYEPGIDPLSESQIITLHFGVELKAQDDSFTVSGNALLHGSVIRNDQSEWGLGATTVSVETTPTKGTLSLQSDGAFTYQPSSTFDGSDSFTYRLTNPGGGFTIATVTINAGEEPAFIAGLVTGHADIGIGFELGELEPHVHAHLEEEEEEGGEEHEHGGLEYAPNEILIQVQLEGAQVVPNDPNYTFLGAAVGSTIYVLPTAPTPDLPFLGFGTEEIEAATFDDGIKLELISMSGPGHLSIWDIDVLGAPIVHMATSDGVGASDYLHLLEASHTHRNIGFSAPGDYAVTFRASAAIDGAPITSEDVTYYFSVADGRAPVIALAATPQTYVEQGAAKAIDSVARLTDADSLNFDGGELRVDIPIGGQPDDQLTIRNLGTGVNQISLDGDDVRIGATGGPIVIGTFEGGLLGEPLVVNLNSNATVARIQTLMRSIMFRNPSDNPTAEHRVVRFVVADGDGAISNATIREVTVTPVNDAPVITASSGSETFTENMAPVLVDANITLTDADSSDFDTGRLTVTIAVNRKTTDRLTIVPQGDGPGEINVAGNTVLFEGTAIGTFTGGYTSSGPLVVSFNTSTTPVAVQQLARSIAFANVSENPTTDVRTIRFQVNDGDGKSSLLANKQVQVVVSNDASTISNLGNAVSYTQNRPAIVVAGSALVTDPDSPNFDGGTLTVDLISGATAADVLGIRSQGAGNGRINVSGNTVTYGIGGVAVVIGTWTGGDGVNPLVIQFNSSASLVAVQATIRNITFSVIGNTPTSSRTVRFSLTDGDGGSSLDANKLINVVGS